MSAHVAALPAHKTSAATPGLARTRSNQGQTEPDAPLDDRNALSQILNGIADMQREVRGWARGGGG